MTALVSQNPVQGPLTTKALSTGAGDSATPLARGLSGRAVVECVATGTVAAQAVSFRLEGTMDGNSWYTVGIKQIDNVASPARVLTFTITPGNGTTKNILLIDDNVYFNYRVFITANTLAGTNAGLTTSLNQNPV